MSKRSIPPDPALDHPSTKRAKQIDASTPYTHLESALSSQQTSTRPAQKVVHWFRGKDLRIHDNISLHRASTLASSDKAPLLCLYVFCPAEETFHGTSPARIDFMLEALRSIKSELAELNIPLVVLEAETRGAYVDAVVQWVRDQDVSHVFANYEYEVDELRRDERFVNRLWEIQGDKAEVKGRGKGKGKEKVKVHMFHDQTVVEPGALKTGAGGPMKVFTPYCRVWMDRVKRQPELLDTVPPPRSNEASVKTEYAELFNSPIPQPPQDKQFASDKEKQRIRALWPPGHAAADKRMDAFIKQISRYAATRSNPAKNSTSRMSAYFSAGMYSVREALAKVRAYNSGSTDFTESGSREGVYAWVREIVFRELYRQTTLTTPHTVMNLPQNLKFEFVVWEDDAEGWEKWCQGRTGEPFIDAGMRQLNTEAYMHNRLRMNVSSYLYCNLLIDYRRGERYFASTLVDWDFCNNTQGWEPSYTVFNPVSQAEKNDPEGDYIRKWVPELKGVKGKAVFAPYERLSKDEFAKLGYPKPHVNWKETKARAIERFKRDMKDASP